MFNGSPESLTSPIVVPNVDEDVFSALLTFIYTNKVPVEDNIADRLLVVANEYRLKYLVRWCSYQLLKEITVPTALPYLELAETCVQRQLKRQIIEFVCEHRTKLLEQQLGRS